MKRYLHPYIANTSYSLSAYRLIPASHNEPLFGCFQCQKELEKLIGWREMLRSTEMQAVKKTSTFSLRRSFRTPKKISHPFHKMYIECHKKLQELREELRRLTDTKVLILSVKEAIRSTVAELRSGTSSPLLALLLTLPILGLLLSHLCLWCYSTSVRKVKLCIRQLPVRRITFYAQ